MNKNPYDAGLAGKYDLSAFDYIEYPHKSFWTTAIGDKDFRTALRENANGGGAFTLYVHIPFCRRLCYFCLCHKEIGSDYSKVAAYLDSLYLEIRALRTFLDSESLALDVRDIYVGGGSPTLLKDADFDRLVSELGNIADPGKVSDFTIEVDPCTVSPGSLARYASKGVNKISIGIQDFDEGVQKTINRIQPPEMVEAVIAPEIRRLYKSVNFDILVGLPGQTVASITSTMERVARMSPDRISFTYMNYAPERYPHQKLMLRSAALPDKRESRAIFDAGLEIMLRHGYVRNGWEHFSKPEDDVAKAKAERKARYNSLGVTRGGTSGMIGLGRYSYSGIGDYYFQHFYEQERYEAGLGSGLFPVYRGFHLDRDDKLRREIIQTLRTNLAIDITAIESAYKIDFSGYFRTEIGMLEAFCRDGLTEISGSALSMTKAGVPFTLQVCRVFDKYLRLKEGAVGRQK